jgi:hypothetical protein
MGPATWGTTARADVGHFTQVVNQVSCVKQGKGPASPAKVQDGVKNQDVVLTAEQSRAMMRFLDDTTLTVGPKSELTIEDYLYDADKAKRHAVVQLVKGVVETVAPRVIPTDQPDFVLRTPTATAGIRGTKYYTVAGPNYTVFYVKEGKIRVRAYSKDTDPGGPAMKCIAQGLRKGLPIEEVINQCLSAGLDPCALVKAAVIQGADLEKLVKTLMEKAQVDPQFQQICAPCIVMKCAVEALRAMKEEDVGPGKYAVLMENLAPIVGDMKPGDFEAVANLLVTGIEGDIPNFPPSSSDIALASLPEAMLQVADALMSAGANLGEIQTCLGGLGYPDPQTFTYATPLPALIPATVTPSLSGQGGGGNPELQEPSRFR